MKKILMATRNKDKFKIISKLVLSVFNNYQIESLADLEQDINDVPETGDVINRAKEKALNVYNQLDNNNYGFIIGIDDVIQIRGKVIENVKEYINDILFNNYLEDNETVSIIRAYSFINNAGKEISVLTETPFIYHPLTYKFDIEKNSFPLNHVMFSIDNNIAVANMSEEETNIYHLKYALSKLNEIKHYFEEFEKV